MSRAHWILAGAAIGNALLHIGAAALGTSYAALVAATWPALAALVPLLAPVSTAGFALAWAIERSKRA